MISLLDHVMFRSIEHRTGWEPMKIED